MEAHNEFIAIRNLCKSFVIGHVIIDVLKGISLTVKKGEMLGIVGASGVGKSSLLHILGTLDRPTEGSVYFNGQDIFAFDNNQLSHFRNQKIGFIFQFNQLLSEFTALENTQMPALIHRKNRQDTAARARQLLCDVGLGDRCAHKPGELSGGEQQRVAIARSLMNNPSVVLADEPTGNLDTGTGDSIYTLLRKFNIEREQTFIIVTHNEKLVHKMDRVVRIVDGTLEGVGDQNPM